MRIPLRLLQVGLEPQRHAALVLEGEVDVAGMAVDEVVREASHDVLDDFPRVFSARAVIGEQHVVALGVGNLRGLRLGLGSGAEKNKHPNLCSFVLSLLLFSIKRLGILCYVVRPATASGC